MLKYIESAKRARDIQAAREISAAMERVAIIDNPGTSAASFAYTLACMWNKHTPFPDATDADLTIVDYMFLELGEVPVSAVDEDYFWIVEYDGETGVVSRIYLAESPSPSSPQYELYPDGSAYISGN